MSSALAEPTPSPLPRRPNSPHRKPEEPCHGGKESIKPKHRLQILDLNHAGTRVFLEHTKLHSVTKDAISKVFKVLYKTGGDVPPVRSVTLILVPMGGVAYTRGIELDNEHKEIRFSLDYIANQESESASRQRDEISGVIVHEMVHVWQWNGHGLAPGGLIEGIADFVRLKAGLAPPHWKREAGEQWDAGYATTAYFLEWLDCHQGGGLVPKLNQSLKHKYVEEDFWPRLCGKEVGELWQRYRREFVSSGERDNA